MSFRSAILNSADHDVCRRKHFFAWFPSLLWILSPVSSNYSHKIETHISLSDFMTLADLAQNSSFSSHDSPPQLSWIRKWLCWIQNEIQHIMIKTNFSFSPITHPMKISITFRSKNFSWWSYPKLRSSDEKFHSVFSTTKIANPSWNYFHEIFERMQYCDVKYSFSTIYHFSKTTLFDSANSFLTDPNKKSIEVCRWIQTEKNLNVVVGSCNCSINTLCFISHNNEQYFI